MYVHAQSVISSFYHNYYEAYVHKNGCVLNMTFLYTLCQLMIKSFRESIAILLFGWVFVKASKLRDVLGNGGIDSY